MEDKKDEIPAVVEGELDYFKTFSDAAKLFGYASGSFHRGGVLTSAAFKTLSESAISMPEARIKIPPSEAKDAAADLVFYSSAVRGAGKSHYISETFERLAKAGLLKTRPAGIGIGTFELDSMSQYYDDLRIAKPKEERSDAEVRELRLLQLQRNAHKDPRATLELRTLQRQVEAERRKKLLKKKTDPAWGTW